MTVLHNAVLFPIGALTSIPSDTYYSSLRLGLDYNTVISNGTNPISWDYVSRQINWPTYPGYGPSIEVPSSVNFVIADMSVFLLSSGLRDCGYIITKNAVEVARVDMANANWFSKGFSCMFDVEPGDTIQFRTFNGGAIVTANGSPAHTWASLTGYAL